MSYLKTWRRKLGIVTLLAACVFAAGWVRSLSTTDNVVFRWSGDKFYVLVSIEQTISFWIGHRASQDAQLEIFPIWRSALTTKPGKFANDNYHWRWRFFNFGEATTPTNSDGSYSHFWVMPYWSVVIPLTLISAWLVLAQIDGQKSLAAAESQSQ